MTIHYPWQRVANSVARLILASLFLMAACFKLLDLNATADMIEMKGFPVPLGLAVVATLFEMGLAVSLASGRLIRPFALLGIPYVLVLGFLYHGPPTWAANQLEFAIFTYHFVFVAALLLVLSPTELSQAQTER